MSQGMGIELSKIPSQEQTGSTYSGRYIEGQEKGHPRVFGQMLPVDLHEPTSWIVEDDENEDLGSEGEFESSTPAEALQLLRTKTGLGWAQLAVLFGVRARSLHYWNDGNRKMNDRYFQIAKGLVDIVETFGIESSFRVRSFFEDQILSKELLLKAIQNLDFVELEVLIEKKFRDKEEVKALPISLKNFQERLPEQPIIASLGEAAVRKSNAKGRVARIAKRRKKL